MDSALTQHLIMSSLKNMNREYVTKETTSLLMKELDNLRTGDGPSDRVGERTTTQHEDTLFPDHPPLSDVSHTNVQSAAINRRPSEPHSVARAILQAVRNRCRQRGSSLSLTPKKLAAGAAYPLGRQPISNGHATEEELQRACTSVAQHASPGAYRRGRVKNKFSLDIGSRTGLKQRTRQYGQQYQSHNSASPPPSLERADNASAANRPTDEHKLIAFNSALLQVSPQQSPTTPLPELRKGQLRKPRPQSMQETSTSMDGSSSVGSKDQQSTSVEPEGDGNFVEPISTIFPDYCSTSSPNTERFLQLRNRFCTSYRVKVPNLKNPVDACVLPNGCLVIADYDNGFMVLNRAGDIVKHVTDHRNACGVACSVIEEFRLHVLSYKDGCWTVNSYSSALDIVDSIVCPEDAQIETWALRKLDIGQDGLLYLMATGEHKLVVWSYDFAFRTWKVLVTENSRRGGYNDFSVKFDAVQKQAHFLLCDWKKSQLSSVIVTENIELAGIQSIKMKRVKGQEWIVQGPRLAVWDEDSDILVYDGSGKLFLFDGERFKCKKIISDLGKGEVGAICVKNGWCYALCRYRLCIEAFLYKECAETSL